MKLKLSLWGWMPRLSFNILSTIKRCFIGQERSVKYGKDTHSIGPQHDKACLRGF